MRIAELRSFNGAPTSQSGIEAAQTVTTSTTSRLQWSPDLAVGDRDAMGGCMTAPKPLQWSPDLAVGDRYQIKGAQLNEQMLQWSPDLAVGDRRERVGVGNVA